MREVSEKKVREECKACHKKSFRISTHGLCASCVCEKVKLARCQIKSKEGAIYEKWKENLTKSLNR